MAVDLCHSDKKLDLTETWSSAFFTILKAALGETRTRYGWLRPIASYELTHTMVQQLQECPCRCQISALSIEPLTKRGSRSDAPPPLTSGEVPSSLRGTFFDSKKN